jgi:DNA polymerase-1
MAKKTKRVKSRDKLLMIIDGSNLAHRAYQKFENLKASNGKKTGLIYGFMRLLNSYIIRFNPTYVLVTFDTLQSKSSNFRNNLLGGYKEHRKKNNLSMDYEQFNYQLRSVKKMLKYLNITVIWDNKGLGHESDDYIGKSALESKGKVLIISSDKDFCQLIDDRIKVFNPFRDMKLNKRNCKDVMGYSPEECVDYLCLVGDKSDDIPGYKGIGEVKARKFLDQFGSIENFLESEEKFPGIDNEGLSELYKRNKSLIDIRVALKEYPITTIPIYYNKKNEILIKKLMGQFSEYSLNSFLTQEFLKPFKTLKQWKNI